MKVLKDLVSLEVEDMSDAEEAVELVRDMNYTRHRLQCIATAFELLSGQGENLTRYTSAFTRCPCFHTSLIKPTPCQLYGIRFGER